MSYCAKVRGLNCASLKCMCSQCILLIVYAFSIHAIQNNSIFNVLNSERSACILNAMHPKWRAFWMGPIEHVGVLDHTYWTHLILDNPADVWFRQDAGKCASRQNRTSAGLSNFLRVGWVLSITPMFWMGSIQNARCFGCIALKMHALRSEYSTLKMLLFWIAWIENASTMSNIHWKHMHFNEAQLSPRTLAQ